MKKDKITIEEKILNFDFTEDLDLEALPKEEREQFNENLFGNLIERIVKKTGAVMSEKDQEEVVKMLEENRDIKNIFDFIADRNNNFAQEVEEEFFDFKQEIYKLLN